MIIQNKNFENNSLHNINDSFFSKNNFTFLLKHFLTFGAYNAIKNLNKVISVNALKHEKKILIEKNQKEENRWRVFNIELQNKRAQASQSQLKEPDFSDLIRNYNTLKQQDPFIPQQNRYKQKLLNLIFIIKNIFLNIITFSVYSIYKKHKIDRKLELLKNELCYLYENSNFYKQIIKKDMDALSLLIKNPYVKETNPHKQTLIQLEELSKADRKEIASFKAQLKQKKIELEHFNSAFQEMKSDYDRQAQAALKSYSLEKELKKLINDIEKGPQINQLITQLGLINSSYIPRVEDKEIPGAFGVNEIEETLNEPWSDYAKRYNNLRTAEEIISRSFDFIVRSVLMTKEKYQMTNSYLTSSTPGFHVIYRLMALDLLKGAELQAQDCRGGYQLKINNCSVLMLPLRAEKVLRHIYLPNSHTETKVVIRYQQKDNFTPHEEIGPITDAVSAKWIIAQLSSKEQEYLETLLASPLIENHYPAYQEMCNFLSSSESSVDLIKTASDLIIDLAQAFKNHFEQPIIINQWRALQTEGIISENHEEIYVKQEEDWSALRNIKNPVKPSFDEWKIQPQLLEKHFGERIQLSMSRYQCFFRNLKSDLLQNPLFLNEKIPHLTLETLDKYYYTSHNMLSVYGKNQHCLFSNLLTILTNDPREIHGHNVGHLKESMANYLEKYPNLFKEKIKEIHKCSLDHYILWLRDKCEQSSIQLNNLTPLEIEIAAFTFGVRIVVFPLSAGEFIGGVGDEQGRVLPEQSSHTIYYGPYTKELLMMCCAVGSYYGMFPKIKLEEIVNKELLKNASFIEEYWKEMDQRRRESRVY